MKNRKYKEIFTYTLFNLLLLSIVFLADWIYALLIVLIFNLVGFPVLLDVLRDIEREQRENYKDLFSRFPAERYHYPIGKMEKGNKQ